MTVNLSDPAANMARLEEIERDLGNLQNTWEAAADRWFVVKGERSHAEARAFLGASGTVAERKAVGDRESALIGVKEEALYQALKGTVDVLETRANILMSLLKAQGRTGG